MHMRPYPNNLRDLQVQRKGHPPFFGKIYPDGRVEEVVFPPIKEPELIFGDNDVSSRASKVKGHGQSKSYRGLGGLLGGLAGGAGGLGGIVRKGLGALGGGGLGGLGGGAKTNAQFPECGFQLEVYLYYGPNWISHAGDEKQAEIKAKRIGEQAALQFVHAEFPTKIIVNVTLKKLSSDHNLLMSFSPPPENHKKGRLHAFLATGDIGESFPQPGVGGIAFTSTVCGKILGQALKKGTKSSKPVPVDFGQI